MSGIIDDLANGKQVLNDETPYKSIIHGRCFFIAANLF